jgi:DNA-binding SARP family transcriptional activator
MWSMSSIQIFFFGPAEFRCDDRHVELRSAKATALLAYLAVTGTPVSRDRLTDLLWPQSLPDAARKNLRNTLWAIRKALGDEVFAATDPDRLALSAHVWTDVAAFEAAARATAVDELRAAVELYRAPLLDGLLLRDAPDLEIWLTTERERFERSALRLLERLVAAYRAAGDWPVVLATAGQALQIDRLQEPMYRASMEAHARLGARAEALHLYERLRVVLARELGVDPLPETEALREAIRDGTLLPAESPLPGSVPSPVGAAQDSRPPPAPFVGRQAELAALSHELQLAAGGQSRVVAVSGELGIGKSRLWQEWSASLPPGPVLLATRCLDTTRSLPFAPLTHLLNQQVCLQCLFQSPARISPLWLAELARLMPEIRERLPRLPVPVAVPREEERRRLFEAFTQVLLALEGRPLVLFVDDAHWIDRASLDWLVYLVDRSAGKPLLLIIAYRPCEAAARLEQVIASWGRTGILRQLSLPHLSLEEATELLAALGTDRALAGSLHARSAGNPYYLLELRDAAPDDVPSQLAELVRLRLGRLPETARQVLQAAAVLDAGFEFATLRRTSGRGEEETLDALDALLDAAILREQEGHYDFVHPLVATVVHNDLSIARRSFLHRRAAEVLEATHAGRLAPIAGQLARHYAGAGRPGQAARYAELAARRSLALTATAEAVAFYRQALRWEPTPSRRLGLGRALYLRGELEEGRDVLGQALAEFEAEDDRGRAARACLALAESYLPSGQGDEAIRWAERALSHLGPQGDTADRAYAHYLLGAGSLQSGKPLSRAEADLIEATRLARDGDLTEIRARSQFELGNLLAQRGDLAGAIHAFERSLDLSRAAGLSFQALLSHNNLAFHALLAGDLEMAREQIEQGLQMADEFSLLLPRQYLHSTRGEIALAEGQLDDADAWFGSALVEAERYGNRPQAANIRANQGLVARARGELNRALDLLETAYRAARAGSDVHLLIKIELWLAELHLARNDVQAAREMLARAEARLAGSERHGLRDWADHIRAGLPS